MKKYEHLDKAMCRELEKLDKKYAGDVPEMSQQDVDRADTLYHALKCGETYYAMMGHEEDDEEEGHSYRGGRGYSYARFRSPRTGRYMSRDDGWSGRYPGEYGYSGHYPMEYIDPYWDRR